MHEGLDDERQKTLFDEQLEHEPENWSARAGNERQARVSNSLFKRKGGASLPETCHDADDCGAPQRVTQQRGNVDEEARRRYCKGCRSLERIAGWIPQQLRQ